MLFRPIILRKNNKQRGKTEFLFFGYERGGSRKMNSRVAVI